MLKKHEDEVKTTKSVQRKADDRPWQRESSGAQPESTSPDPAKGDNTKGMHWALDTIMLILEANQDQVDFLPHRHDS